jgi:hypothetical protein
MARVVVFGPEQASITLVLSTGALVMTTDRTFAVSIDEIKQSLVFGDTFSSRYTKAITMSDGSVREITLRPVMRDGQLVVEVNDGGHVSYMGPSGTTVHGSLMINLTDMGIPPTNPASSD